MKFIHSVMLVIAAIAGSSYARAAGQGFESDRVVLYQPDNVLRARIPDVEAFADYCKRLQAVCTEFFASVTQPETLYLVVAVKPGKRSRVWFISSTREPTDKEREPLRKLLEAVPVLDVLRGPVALALSGNIAGGDGKRTEDAKDFKPPLPTEWERTAKLLKPPVMIPDAVLNVLWPDTPGEMRHIHPPDGYSVQKLEGLNGEILKPDGWFFATESTNSSLVYRIAKEDVSLGKGFITGFTINVIPRVSTYGGGDKKASDHGALHLDEYLKHATLVVRDKPTKQGDFERQGMTVDEHLTLMGKELDCRLALTTFADNEADLLIITSFGCPRADWEANQKIYTTIASDVILMRTADESKK